MRNILIFSRQPAERCKASPVPENCPRPQIKVICSQGEKQYFPQNERRKGFLNGNGRNYWDRMWREEVGTLMFTQENKWFADQGGWQMCARYTIQDVYTFTSIK